jgi:hypothetical protein
VSHLRPAIYKCVAGSLLLFRVCVPSDSVLDRVDYDRHVYSRAHQLRVREQQLKEQLSRPLDNPMSNTSNSLRGDSRLHAHPPSSPFVLSAPATGPAPPPLPMNSTAGLPPPPAVLATDAAAERELEQKLLRLVALAKLPAVPWLCSPFCCSILPTREQIEQLQALMGSITTVRRRVLFRSIVNLAADTVLT